MCSSDDNLPIWAACLIFLGVIIGTKDSLARTSDCSNIDEESWCFSIFGSAHGPLAEVVTTCNDACTPESQLNEKKKPARSGHFRVLE